MRDPQHIDTDRQANHRIEQVAWDDIQPLQAFAAQDGNNLLQQGVRRGSAKGAINQGNNHQQYQRTFGQRREDDGQLLKMAIFKVERFFQRPPAGSLGGKDGRTEIGSKDHQEIERHQYQRSPNQLIGQETSEGHIADQQ
ncbi:hypothetical protein D3C75_919720 [compost metagenome]